MLHMRIVRFSAYFAGILILVAYVSGTTTPGTQATVDVRDLLDKQVAAWNRGDLDGYMAGYWNSNELTFYSNAKETFTWQGTLEHYRERYKQSKNGMGKLSLSVQLEQLDEHVVLGKGEWRLSMPDGTHPHGLTTVVARKLPEGWRIVHDHSSSSE
jgi:ketosteroid isomerase-like protein